MPSGERALNAIRRWVGSRSSSERYGHSGGASRQSEPGSGPCVASSMHALSRTLRDTMWFIAAPWIVSPVPGPDGVRPRPGLSPNRPVEALGIRIEPPPSLAPANGTMPAATAAADPPLDPPEERVKSHGLRVGPH